MRILTGPAAGLIAAILIFDAAAAAAQAIGQVVRLEGAVTAARGAGSVALQVGSAVFRRDTIATQSGSRLKIELKDGSLLAIGEESRVALVDYTEPRGGNGLSAVVRLLLGIVRATLPKGPNKSFEIHTRAAIASVRSTDWLVERTRQRTSVLSIDGRVTVRAPSDTWRAALDPGVGIDVGPNGAAPEPKRWPADRAARALERVTVR